MPPPPLPTAARPLVLHTGDCRRVLPRLPARSVDCVVADGPYPGIDREYGTWTEEDWFGLMEEVVPECRRVLKPTGSAVFVMQPNSERAGRMRLWVFEFIATWGRRWNLIQDAYSWNYAQLPFGASTTCGLMRGSVKHCVWLGPADCYRDQDAVLWAEAERSRYRGAIARAGKRGYTSPSASKRATDTPRLDAVRCYGRAAERGGVTPFNLLPATNTKNAAGEAGAGHPARTPPDLARFWVKYLCPPGGIILDPFCGTGGVLEVARDEKRLSVGIEIRKEYVSIAKRNLVSNANKIA